MTDQDRREQVWLEALLLNLDSTRDRNPGRDGVTELEHCLQTADRARRAGADDELIAVALLHDAAKPLSLTSHGEVTAEILSSRVSRRAYELLRVHGKLQAAIVHGEQRQHVWTHDAHRLAQWDAASFDPAYPTPSLDEFQSLLDRLYDNEFAPGDAFQEAA